MEFDICKVKGQNKFSVLISFSIRNVSFFFFYVVFGFSFT